tara:strand:- start:78 stop:470 length:393 start_codon:yes stop_codon:yes gene_type:complete
MIDIEFKKTIVLDFDSRTAQVDGKNINLTSTEYDLICVFYKKRGKVLSRNMISRMLYDREVFDPLDRSIDVSISRLRQKLNLYFEEQSIKSIRGKGYILTIKIGSSQTQTKSQNEFKGILELTNLIGLSR